MLLSEISTSTVLSLTNLLYFMQQFKTIVNWVISLISGFSGHERNGVLNKIFSANERAWDSLVMKKWVMSISDRNECHDKWNLYLESDIDGCMAVVHSGIGHHRQTPCNDLSLIQKSTRKRLIHTLKIPLSTHAKVDQKSRVRYTF